MKKIKNKILGIVAFTILILLAVVNAQISSTYSSNFYSSTSSSSYVHTQVYKPSFNNYYSSSQIKEFWPKVFDIDRCYGRQDFIIQIPPAGCTPAVVRSDLLEEQPVPVFCQINAIKVNPLISVSQIRNINFRRYPSEISGVGFHPARAALRTWDRQLTGSPIIENIGYAVILLRPYRSEKEMPDFIEANLTALIVYDAERIFGVGKSEFYLPVLTEDEWENQYKENSFWKGQGYLRADWVEDERASVSIYTDSINRVNSVVLEKGKTSKEIYLPSYYCQVALNLKLNDVGIPEKQARLFVSSQSIEEEYWVREGDKFSSCIVEDIEVYKFGGGTIQIKCPKERFTLSTSPTNKVSIEKGGKASDYELGSAIKDNIYPVFVGSLPENIEIEYKENRMFVVVVQSDIGEQEIKNKIKSGEIRNALNNLLDVKIENKQEFVEKVKQKIKKVKELKNPEVLFKGDTYNKRDIKFLDSSVSLETEYTKEEKEIENYFEKTNKIALKIVENFPDEKNRAGEIYGKKALIEAADLAGKLGKKQSQVNILSKLLEEYPESSKKQGIGREISDIKQRDSRNAYETTEINNEIITIQLVEVKEPTKEQLSVELEINGQEKTPYPSIDDVIYRDEIKKTYLKIKKINENSILIEWYRDPLFKDPIEISEEVKLKENKIIAGQKIYIKKINMQKVASISLTPKAMATQSETDFTFRIGIEKRAIKLSPEKTEEMLDDLNKSIDKWEKISKSLGKTVKGMKSACFATTAILTVKNLINNMGGKSLARQQAMRGKGGWYEKCTELVENHPSEYSNMNDCLRKKSREVEQSVNDIYGAIKKVDSQAKDIYKLEDNEKITGQYLERVLWPAVELNKNKKINEISIGKILDSKETLTELNKEGYLGERDMRDISTWLKVLEKAEPGSVAYQRAEIELSTLLDTIEKSRAEIQAEKHSQESFSSFAGRVSPQVIAPKSTKTIYIETTTLTDRDIEGLKKGSETDFKLEKSDEVVALTIPAGVGLIGDKSIIAKINERGQIEKAYSINASGSIQEDLTKEVINYVHVKSGIKEFEKRTSELCKNKYLDYRVKFYTTSPYKGMPAVVPVDIGNGWYAATKQILPILGNVIEGGTKPYTEAGEVKSFWLVNVGKNGREEFDSLAGDDYPRTMINLDTRQPLDQIGCLDSKEARRLVEQAIINIREAASQYRAGVGKIELQMANGDLVKIPVERAGGSPSNLQCQDFMSPNDCYIMFNLCDPVLCPSSRCNLGGTYNVDNVIQSGIVGSIALCLPNVKEGIFVPVCLTGIQAGLDTYISILKAKQQCLEVSLETGKMVGICDEIYSIYACEFFWRQLAPIARYGLPKLIEFISGKGTRGGGEYASVQSAWNNMEGTMSYFTNEYAINAMEAFKMRSTDEVGTEICKVFVSQRYPSGKGFFDSLIEPDSPPQFYARFDEIPYTEATVPATSHYKIFYHIYAGKDHGSYYSVFLKSPPETSLYASNPVLYIDGGYIANGSFVSQTIDTTAPSGYKELCVRIDLKEECGFKQVSTDFAMNYIKDEYIKEQATQEITTESECISGTISPLALVNPNIQEGVAETIQPEVYKRGLTRVCSSENPGTNIDSSRWKDVGYCGDKKVRCWLDTSSVKDVIKEDRGLLNKTLTEVKEMDLKNRFKDTWDDEATQDRLNELDKLINDFSEQIKSDDLSEFNQKLEQIGTKQKLSEISNTLKEIQEKAFIQEYKAEALFKMFKFYEKITLRLKELAGKTKTNEPKIEVGDKINIVMSVTEEGEEGYKLYENIEIVIIENGVVEWVQKKDRKIVDGGSDTLSKIKEYQKKYEELMIENEETETEYFLKKDGEIKKIIHKEQGEEKDTQLYINIDDIMLRKSLIIFDNLAKDEKLGEVKDNIFVFNPDEEPPHIILTHIEKLNGAEIREGNIFLKP